MYKQTKLRSPYSKVRLIFQQTSLINLVKTPCPLGHDQRSGFTPYSTKSETLLLQGYVQDGLSQGSSECSPRSKSFPFPRFGKILQQVEEDESEANELEQVGQHGDGRQVAQVLEKRFIE